MLKSLKKLSLKLLYLVVDKRTFRTLKKTPIISSIGYNLRFKMANWNLFLNQNEKRLAAFKNKHKGKRCFIIGNGPSLNKVDLTQLKDEYTFGVNAIYLNYDKMGFYPTYYVVEDFLIAEDRASEINNYEGSEVKFIGTFLEYILKKDRKTIMTNMFINFEEPFVPFFSKDCLKGIGFGGTVSYQCLQLAYYMGFEEVYLVGFDHNYAVVKEKIDKKTSILVSDADDENHFSKDYYGKGFRWHDPKVDRMERSFQVANEVFIGEGRNVYNATPGGHLEVFQRVEYNSLFIR